MQIVLFIILLFLLSDRERLVKALILAGFFGYTMTYLLTSGLIVSTQDLLILISVLIILAIFLSYWINRSKPVTIINTSFIQTSSWGIGLGILFYLASMIIPLRLVPNNPIVVTGQNSILVTLLFALVYALVHELIWRGLVMTSIEDTKEAWRAPLIVALFYLLMQNQASIFTWQALLAMGIMQHLLGTLAQKQGILAPILASLTLALLSVFL